MSDLNFELYVCGECGEVLLNIHGAPYCPRCEAWIDELEDENGTIVYPKEANET